EREPAVLGEPQCGRGNHRIGEAPPREDRRRVAATANHVVADDRCRMDGYVGHAGILARWGHGWTRPGAPARMVVPARRGLETISMPLGLISLHPLFVAEASGIELRSCHEPAELAAIRRAMDEHAVL